MLEALESQFEELEDFYTKTAPVKVMCIFLVTGMQGMIDSQVLWAIIQPNLDNFRKFGEVNLRGVIKERFDNASQELPVNRRLQGFTITLDDLPMMAPGKLNRLEIKSIYEPRVVAGKEGSLPSAGRISPKDLELTTSIVGKNILKCLKKLSGIQRHIILEDSLELDLGIDSLGRIELTSSLESAFSADIKVGSVSRAFTVKDLILEITECLKGARDIPLEDQGIMTGEDYWKNLLNVHPQQETLEMLELSTGFCAWAFRVVLTAIDCLIFRMFFSIQAEGFQHVPKDGAYILYGNHSSFLDGPAIGACLPRRPVFQIFYFVFGPYFFRPLIKNRLLRNLVKMGRFIPFDFSTHFLEALRACYYVLEHGKGLCFFPEGLRSTDGKIGEFKKGFGILAKVTNCLLVPVAIIGAHEAWPSTAKYPRRYPIKVIFGMPIKCEDLLKQGLSMGTNDPDQAICLAARKQLVELKTKGEV